MTVGLRLFEFRKAPVIADASALVLAILFAGAVLVDIRLNVDGAETDWMVAAVAGVKKAAHRPPTPQTLKRMLMRSPSDTM